MYSSAADVIGYTGVTPDDLNLANDVELTNAIDGWLTQVTDLINEDRGRDFAADGAEVPPGIHNIAMRACANMVMLAMQRRQSGVVQVSDYSVRMVQDTVFSKAIREDLAMYGQKRGTQIGVWVVDTSLVEGV